MTAEPTNALQVFNVSDTDIRFGATSDGVPFAVAVDFAKAMGYAKTQNATDLLEEDEKGHAPVVTPGGRQRLAVIYEDGMWELIFRSSLPGAKAIKKQVKAILRQIRETGSYVAEPASSSPSVTVPWEHAAAIARRHHGLMVDVHGFKELLNKGGILTTTGRPHTKWEHLFWPVPSGTRWEVYTTVLPQLIHFAKRIKVQQALAEQELQLSLPFPTAYLDRYAVGGEAA